MKKRFFLILLFLPGCSRFPYLTGPGGYTEWVVYVEADTEWTGMVAGRGVSGFGDRSYRVSNLGACWNLRKTRITGLLRAYAMPANMSSRTQNVPKVDDRATTAPYGVISGCL